MLQAQIMNPVRPMLRDLRVCIVIAATGMLGIPSYLTAEESDRPGNQLPTVRRDITMKTLGGRQFWGDVHFFHGWRIQHNVVMGHFRLLDGDDYRHASGTLDECRSKLDEIAEAQALAPMSGKAVILVHGIIRSSKSFRGMQQRLKQAGYHVVGFDYPSTRVTIDDAADYLHRTIQSLEGIEEINFVVHSMGGLVVRSYLGKHRDERIGRMVMIGVPNLGARLADHLKGVYLFKTIYGPAGQQLVSDPAGFVSKLSTPDFEFAIISGGRGNIRGYNPMIPGDDDGTVSVSNTRLPGATDFVVVPGIHSFLMNDSQVVDCTTRFLSTGRLRQDGEPHPIPRPAEQAPGRVRQASSSIDSKD